MMRRIGGAIWAALCAAAFVLCLTSPARAGGLSPYGAYGFEEKYDVNTGGGVSKANYVAAMLGLDEHLELELALRFQSGSSMSVDHILASYKYAFRQSSGLLRAIYPVAALGLGVRMVSGSTPYLGTGAGIEMDAGSFRLRISHVSKNVFWGSSKLGEAAFMFAVGYDAR